MSRSSDGLDKDDVFMDLIKYLEKPFEISESTIDGFIKDMEPFMDHKYYMTLEKYGFKWDYERMMRINVGNINNVECIFALLTGVIRMERFSEGTIKDFFQLGRISEWIKRLDEI